MLAMPCAERVDSTERKTLESVGTSGSVGAVVESVSATLTDGTGAEGNCKVDEIPVDVATETFVGDASETLVTDDVVAGAAVGTLIDATGVVVGAAVGKGTFVPDVLDDEHPTETATVAITAKRLTAERARNKKPHLHKKPRTS